MSTIFFFFGDLMKLKHSGATVCKKIILYGNTTVNNCLGGFKEHRNVNNTIRCCHNVD